MSYAKRPALGLPAAIGAALVLPFVVLEGINRHGAGEELPIALFGFLWLLSAALVLVLATVVREARAPSGVVADPRGLLLRAVLLVPLAWMWASLVLDQMPCFLGVPNCD